MRLILVLAVVVISACAVWPVGGDPKGRALQAKGAPVLAALSRFQKERGHFPQSLSELVPGYLTAIPSSPALRYEQQSGSVGFEYSPSWPQPGNISCSAVAGAQEWSCVGYI